MTILIAVISIIIPFTVIFLGLSTLRRNKTLCALEVEEKVFNYLDRKGIDKTILYVEEMYLKEKIPGWHYKYILKILNNIKKEGEDEKKR